MSDTLYVALKKLEKAFDNIPMLEASQKMNEMTDAIKKLGETLRGSLELNVEVDKDKIIKAATGCGLNSPILYFDDVIKTQNRKHKKKRINKKWAKRYGYNVQYIPHEIKIMGVDLTKNGVEYKGVLK